MKTAKIVPLPTNTDRKEFSNYRPGSILPQFSNILETFFYNRLVPYVKKNNVMHKSQNGFKEVHSTGLSHMELIEDIASNLDNNLVTTGVLLI